MKSHYKNVTAILISLLVVINLIGCSRLMSSRMPAGSISMEQAYHRAIRGTESTQAGGTFRQARAKVALLRRAPHYRAYTRTPKNDISSQFSALPNPNIVMYVYPHQAGSGDNRMPVPGYSTVFPLYQHVYYAMPGESLR